MARGGGTGQRGLGIDIRSSFVVKDRIPGVIQKLQTEAGNRAKEVAEFLYDYLIEEMYNSAGGRIYPYDKKNWDSGEHEASAASGSAYPAVWYGDFMKSLGITSKTFDRAVTYAIGSTSLIGVHLEFGTVRMKPRPWLSKIQQVGLDVAPRVMLRKFDRV